MIKNGLYLKSAINSLTSSHDDLQEYVISYTEWAILEKIAEFLEPFKDLTIKMSVASHSTVFNIIPLFNIIIDHIKDVSSSKDGQIPTQIRQAAREARGKLVQYYSKTNTIIILCTALDPRRRFNYFIKKEFPEE